MPIRKYVVVPPKTGGLENVREIASNLWFSWDADALQLFEHLDEQIWEQTNHNPQRLLISLSRSKLDKIRLDEAYASYAEHVRERFRTYLTRTRPYDFKLPEPVRFTTAYFSLEFGLTECLPIYSGGLGLLAGDHLKSASDLNLPLVAVGLMYHGGYFRQSLNRDGWQEELYPRTEVDMLPLEIMTDDSGAPITVSVDLAGEELLAWIRKAQVGRVPLYLLDSDIPTNPPHLRDVSSHLYGGDQEMRIRQEILLGVGGCRALAALGVQPMVYHLNEGHAAFTVLERLSQSVLTEGLSLEEAKEMVTSQTVITTHTPVPAGNEVFPTSLIEKYFGNFVRGMGLDFEDLMSLGRIDPEDRSEGLCMPVLGMRLSSKINAVSELHSEVAKRMWRKLWPQADLEDVPIVALTNGVHIPSYLSKDLAKLYDRYLGLGWTEDPDNANIWKKADHIPDIELWRTHERCRSRLVSFARERLVRQLKARGASARAIEHAQSVLDPESLTICFARRFATYKRANMLFREPDILAQLLADSERPIQLILAGKAHPADRYAKEYIRNIVKLIEKEPFRSRVVFIEDYDINVAKFMVQGADVWLNTPRRPLEACGTSGMKAAANGALNLSILDGWWDEAYQGDNGWAIGSGEEYEDTEYQDDIESRALYNLMRESVKPVFYERGADDLPADWIAMMKRSIGTICPVFNSHRMVSDYVENFYYPLAENASKLAAEGYKELRDLVAWKGMVRDNWSGIAVLEVAVKKGGAAVKGEDLPIEVKLEIPGFKPDHLRVEVIHGPLDSSDRFKCRNVTRLSPGESSEASQNKVVFKGNARLTTTGLYGYEVRITPQHPNMAFSQRFNFTLRA